MLDRMLDSGVESVFPRAARWLQVGVMFIDHALVKLAVGLIKTYRLFLSPWIGQNCRFYPTCSRYAEEAFLAHGCWRGLLLTLKRLGRCHPGSAGGVDEVPERETCRSCG